MKRKGSRNSGKPFRFIIGLLRTSLRFIAAKEAAAKELNPSHPWRVVCRLLNFETFTFWCLS